MFSSTPLQRDSIIAACGKQLASQIQLDIHSSLPSTNTWLLEQAMEVGELRVCLAEQQTSGRGRRGNKWLSTANRDVIMSIAYVFADWREDISALSLAVGMVVAEYLRSRYQIDVKVKWPNDLMVKQKKLAGILLESAGQPSGACQVVIGIGLNVEQDQNMSANEDYDWQDLAGLGIRPDRNELIGELLDNLVHVIKTYEHTGFGHLVSKWSNYCSLQGRSVRVSGDKQIVDGEACGVDEMGALLVVDNNNLTHRFIDSQVSVRLRDTGSL